MSGAPNVKDTSKNNTLKKAVMRWLAGKKRPSYKIEFLAWRILRTRVIFRVRVGWGRLERVLKRRDRGKKRSRGNSFYWATRL